MKDLKALIEYSNNIHDGYKDIEQHNPSRKCNVLIVFGDILLLFLVVKNLI